MVVGQQNILRERRQYNRWVANESLEDYALRFTAARARKWSIPRVANAALGTVAFLVLEAVGATITLSFRVHQRGRRHPGGGGHHFRVGPAGQLSTPPTMAWT